MEVGVAPARSAPFGLASPTTASLSAAGDRANASGNAEAAAAWIERELMMARHQKRAAISMNGDLLAGAAPRALATARHLADGPHLLDKEIISPSLSARLRSTLGRSRSRRQPSLLAGLFEDVDRPSSPSRRLSPHSTAGTAPSGCRQRPSLGVGSQWTARLMCRSRPTLASDPSARRRDPGTSCFAAWCHTFPFIVIAFLSPATSPSHRSVLRLSHFPFPCSKTSTPAHSTSLPATLRTQRPLLVLPLSERSSTEALLSSPFSPFVL